MNFLMGLPNLKSKFCPNAKDPSRQFCSTQNRYHGKSQVVRLGFLVEVKRFELWTFRTSSERSNQLSYTSVPRDEPQPTAPTSNIISYPFQKSNTFFKKHKIFRDKLYHAQTAWENGQAAPRFTPLCSFALLQPLWLSVRAPAPAEAPLHATCEKHIRREDIPLHPLRSPSDDR